MDKGSQSKHLLRLERFSPTSTGLTLILVLLAVISGVSLGLVLESHHYLSSPYRYVSNCLTFTYVSAWCLRYYPQIILNYTRKTTLGISIDTLLLSLVSFIFYLMFNIYFYVHSNENWYAANILRLHRFIDFGDIAFSLHAVLALITIVLQCFWYDGINMQLPNSFTLATLSMSILLSLLYLYAIFVLSHNQPPFLIQDYFFSLAVVAIFLHVICLIPQCAVNYRSSTFIGIDIASLLLDITGALCCLLEVVLDSVDVYGLKKTYIGLQGECRMVNTLIQYY